MTDERRGHQPTPRGTDDPLDREIRRLLAVDPSPAFEAHVRARVADEPVPAAWRAGWLWPAFGAAAALVLTVAVFRPSPPVDTDAEPATAVTSTGDAAPASSDAAVRPREERPAADRSRRTPSPLSRLEGGSPARLGQRQHPAPHGSRGWCSRSALWQLLTLTRDQPVVVPVSAGARTPVAAGGPPAKLVIPPYRHRAGGRVRHSPHHNRAVEPDSSQHRRSRMTRRITLAVVLAVALASGTAALAQPPLPPPAPPPPPGTPSAEASVDLSVEVTISRYQGDELISSLPYVLSLTSEGYRHDSCGNTR